MAWRAPRISWLHLLRTAGSAAIASENSVAADGPLAYLLDERLGARMRFATSESDHRLTITVPATAAYYPAAAAAFRPSINRLWIPAGHNLAGATLTLRGSDDSGFAVSTVLLNASPVVGAGAISREWSAGVDDFAYLRLEFGGTGAWEFGELVLSETVALERGPAPAWEDRLEAVQESVTLASGEEYVVRHGAPRRRLGYELARPPAGDEAAWLWPQRAPERAFLFDPPFDGEAPIFVRPVSIGRRQGHARPPRFATPAWDLSVALREVRA